MSRSEKVSFQGSTGELLSGIVDVPEGPVKGWGVFSHGFTLGKDSPSASRMCKALADNGVGMLRFDNLGLGESAGLWSEGSFSHKVADTVKAAEFMRDSGRPVSLLVGHSFGGAAVLAAASSAPSPSSPPSPRQRRFRPAMRPDEHDPPVVIPRDRVAAGHEAVRPDRQERRVCCGRRSAWRRRRAESGLHL